MSAPTLPVSRCLGTFGQDLCRWFFGSEARCLRKTCGRLCQGLGGGSRCQRDCSSNWHKLLQHFLGQPFGGSCSHLAERATQARNHLAILWQSWLACRVVVVYSDALQVCCVDTAGALIIDHLSPEVVPAAAFLLFDLFVYMLRVSVRKYSCRTFLFFPLVVDEADKEPSRYLMYCGALHGSRQTIPISVAACDVLATAYWIVSCGAPTSRDFSFGLAWAARSRPSDLELVRDMPPILILVL